VTDPPSGAVVPGVVVADGTEGIPVIYVAADAAPATELQAVTIRPGNGPSAALGNNITVNYCGVGLSTGILFDSSWVRGEPVTFPLVEGGLIAGWTQGVPGMQLGEQRLLVIPSDLAYGSNPPPGIQPDESLVFVVELRDISGEG
jgi:FKBP-type peptidyl-prolyl cis-trans isomerase